MNETAIVAIALSVAAVASVVVVVVTGYVECPSSFSVDLPAYVPTDLSTHLSTHLSAFYMYVCMYAPRQELCFSWRELSAATKTSFVTHICLAGVNDEHESHLLIAFDPHARKKKPGGAGACTDPTQV